MRSDNNATPTTQVASSGDYTSGDLVKGKIIQIPVTTNGRYISLEAGSTDATIRVLAAVRRMNDAQTNKNGTVAGN